MKNLSYLIVLSIFVLLSATACSDVLDTEPESIITVKSFWNTEEDAVGGLYGMYNQFREHSRSNLVLLGDARSELMGYGLQNADYRIKYFENSLTETNADLDWKQMYLIVNYANLVIKYAPTIEFKDELDKNNFLAQAYAMRAYMYFTMTKTWGDLPLISEPVEGYDAETTFKEKSPISDIFNLIKSDIDQANELFSDDKFNPNRSTWSRPALNMLKADVYLWTGKIMGGGEPDITKALSALEAAEVSDVGLLDDFSTIFDYDNKGNKEVIMAVHFRDIEAGNNYFADMYINSADLNSAIDTPDRERIGIAGNHNWWAPTELVRNKFSDDDTRKNASFSELSIYNDEGGSIFYTSVVLKGQGIVDGGTRKFLDDVIIYRYADLLLMKAEAKNALNQDPSEEINAIRRRAYGSNFDQHIFINSSQEVNDSIILEERLLELAFESKRWWDLIRFGKAFDLVPSLQGRENDRHLLLWPIPLNTLSLNSKLTQTPGY